MKYLITLLALLSLNVNAGVIHADYNGLADSGDELFTLTDANAVLDDSGFELIFTYGGFNSYHTIGLFHYDQTGGSVSSMLKLFDDSDTAGTDSNVVWDLANDTAMSKYGSIDLSLTTGLAFGLYFQTDGRTYYSVSDLNYDMGDYYSFHWNDANPFDNENLFVKGWDNGYGSSYDEFVLGISDVSPLTGGIDSTVPEPSALLLMGLGLMGFGLRKKMK